MNHTDIEDTALLTAQLRASEKLKISRDLLDENNFSINELFVLGIDQGDRIDNIFISLVYNHYYYEGYLSMVRGDDFRVFKKEKKMDPFSKEFISFLRERPNFNLLQELTQQSHSHPIGSSDVNKKALF